MIQGHGSSSGNAGARKALREVRSAEFGIRSLPNSEFGVFFIPHSVFRIPNSVYSALSVGQVVG